MKNFFRGTHYGLCIFASWTWFCFLDIFLLIQGMGKNRIAGFFYLFFNYLVCVHSV